MLWYHYVFGAVLIVASIIITIIVLMQDADHLIYPVLSAETVNPTVTSQRV